MGHRFIKQADGRYAVYSTNSDQIIAWNYTWEELVEDKAKEAADDARRSMAEVKAKEPATPEEAPDNWSSWMSPASAIESAQLQLGAITDDGEFNREALPSLEPVVALLKKILAGQWEESDGDISAAILGAGPPDV